MLSYLLRNGSCTVPDFRKLGKGSSHAAPAVDAFAHDSVHLSAGALFEFSGVEMPRIKRWFPVSHDFNRDSEIRELRQRFGDWLGFAWLELLSIGDRNEGEIRGDLDQIALRLAPNSLGKYLGSSQKTARKALEFMAEKEWISVEKNLIRVRNHAKYHPFEESKTIPKRSRPSLPSDPNPLKPPISPQGFEAFWKAYPKKIGKKAALKAWDKAELNGKVQIVLEAVEKQKSWPQWQKEGGQYIPNPTTWLNQGRWEDQPVEEQKEERTGVWAKKFTPEPR